MNEKIPVCTVIALVLLAAGFIAACQNQPRVSALTPVQIASTEINTQPAPT